jgi:hypothetical protein
MSWFIRRPNVSLAVTRFLSEVAPAHEPKPIAGLSPLIRALWRDRRAKECAKRDEALVLHREV